MQNRNPPKSHSPSLTHLTPTEVVMPPPVPRRSFLTTAAAVGATAGLGMPHIARAQAKTLTVSCYGGAYEKFFREHLLPDFQKETGSTVRLALGNAKDNIPLMRAGGVDNPPLDVCIDQRGDRPDPPHRGLLHAH